MKFIKKNWEKLLLFTYIFILPVSLLYAEQTPTSSTSGKIVNPLNTTTTLPTLIHNILIDALKVGIPVVTLAIIYCGFLFVKAQGKPEEITKAKEALLWTLVGAAILLGSWALAQMIQSTVNAL